MGHPTKTKTKSSAPTGAATDVTVPTITPAASKSTARGPRQTHAKKFTQADVDALTAQFNADAAAAAAQMQADHQAEMADLERRLGNVRRVAAEADKEAAEDHGLDNSVPKPRGSAGDGYKLLDAMGLNDNKLEYDLIRRKVHLMCGSVKLDMSKSYSKQDPRKLLRLCDKMREECPYLRRFIGDWATRAITRTYLKNFRGYGKTVTKHHAVQPPNNDDGVGSGAEA